MERSPGDKRAIIFLAKGRHRLLITHPVLQLLLAGNIILCLMQKLANVVLISSKIKRDLSYFFSGNAKAT